MKKIIDSYTIDVISYVNGYREEKTGIVFKLKDNTFKFSIKGKFLFDKIVFLQEVSSGKIYILDTLVRCFHEKFLFSIDLETWFPIPYYTEFKFKDVENDLYLEYKLYHREYLISNNLYLLHKHFYHKNKPVIQEYYCKNCLVCFKSNLKLDDFKISCPDCGSSSLI